MKATNGKTGRPIGFDQDAALEAAMAAIATELSIDRVLQVIVDRVRPLVDARYAALGIVDEAGVVERELRTGQSYPAYLDSRS